MTDRFRHRPRRILAGCLAAALGMVLLCTACSRQEPAQPSVTPADTAPESGTLYTAEGYISKLDYPLRENMLQNAADKMQEVYQHLLSGTDCKVYFSVIPDKNYFLAPRCGYPVLDHERLVQELQEKLPFAVYLDIFPALTLRSYYKTDLHWRQEKLSPVADVLAAGMGAKLTDAFTTCTWETPFRGAYAADDTDAETLYYLTSPLLESCKVTSYNTGTPAPALLYDTDKAGGKNAYEMFLSGAQAILVLENAQAATARELVIFRDSFASSLAPLLASGYSRITLVDPRYIRSDHLAQFLTFDQQDVLFLYSATILNNSISWK